MYTVGHLLETSGLSVEIDLYERLPTPWGLVRAGVAPDHPEKKLIIDRLFAFALNSPKVCFVGNVEIGKDIRHAELVEWYDAVIYALGAAGDMRMGISGEDLQGCWASREFVGFYNGHPDYSQLQFDLSCSRAIVVGNGNVALDVARMLTMPVAQLEKTDIADAALAVLRRSAVKEVILLGRRGHLQSAFNNAELEELEHLRDIDIRTSVDNLADDGKVLLEDADWTTRRKVETLRRLATRRTSGKKRIVFRFLTSPVSLLGRERVEQMLVVHNRLEWDAGGNPTALPTSEQSIINTGLVLRAIGYRGSHFPGLPFDECRGTIPNRAGRVVDGHGALPRAYVVGWIKRGCRGVIGSNKQCARETVNSLLEDLQSAGAPASATDRKRMTTVIRQRKPDVVFFNEWRQIDHSERQAGRATGRPRVKLTRNEDLLQCAHSKSTA